VFFRLSHICAGFFLTSTRNFKGAVLIDVAEKQGSKVAALVSNGSQIVERHGKIRMLIVHVIAHQ